MAEGAFFEDEAKNRTKEMIETVESQTNAEVVVALRTRSARYRETDYLFGFLISLVTLVSLLFLPQSFAMILFPLDVAVGFAIGALISAFFLPLKRAMVPNRHKKENVETQARRAFVDLGISQTQNRNGILVYISLFERRVEVVSDVGIPVEAMADNWTEVTSELQAAIADKPDLDRFLNGLVALGPLLGSVIPKTEDDVNELSDQVQ